MRTDWVGYDARRDAEYQRQDDRRRLRQLCAGHFADGEVIESAVTDRAESVDLRFREDYGMLSSRSK
jgi:hypothetical protein